MTTPADDTARVAAVARLCSGRPGYHTITVKELLTAMSDAVEARQVLGTPTTDPVPAFDRMPCSLATLYRPHPPHTWEPQPGMTPLACPGTPASAPAAPADRATDDRPLSPYYEHPACGFHWHGRDGMDVPLRDGQPVCPRCELRRLADEAQPETATRGGSYLTAEHDTLGMIAARYGGDLFAWERANPWVTDTSMPLPAGLRVAIPADEAQPTETGPTVTDVQAMQTRMGANAATNDVATLLDLIAAWHRSNEGRGALFEDLVQAGFRLPATAATEEPRLLWSDLLGADPDITGGACTQCYMDRVRDRERDMSSEHAHCRAALDDEPVTAATEERREPHPTEADMAHALTLLNQLPATEDDDPICGDRYDDEACELEPGHPGAHCAGTLCWDDEPATATAATEEPQP